MKDNRMLIVMAILMITFIGFGIIIPVMPRLLEQMIHGTISKAASYQGFLLRFADMRDQNRAEGTAIPIVYVAGAFFLPSGIV